MDKADNIDKETDCNFHDSSKEKNGSEEGALVSNNEGSAEACDSSEVEDDEQVNSDAESLGDVIDSGVDTGNNENNGESISEGKSDEDGCVSDDSGEIAVNSSGNSSEDSEDGAEGEDDGFELTGDDFFMPLIQIVEALLFAADEPLSLEKIAKSAGKRIRRDAVEEAINELQTQYKESDRAFEIIEVAEKFQMLTRAEFAKNVQALYGKRAIKEEKDKKLSPAALDTLAIVAYKQPVTRAEVEAVRGVGCGQVMRQLMERGSIKPVGKKMDVIGYPLLYGTTESFLQEFGLASLDVLPMATELRRLTEVDVELAKPEVVEGAGEVTTEVHSKLEGAVVIESAVEGKSAEIDTIVEEDTSEDEELKSDIEQEESGGM